MSFPEPVRISPFIKLFRWSLLVAGIFYGQYKQVWYQGIEYARQAKEYEKHLEREKEKEKGLLGVIEFGEESDATGIADVAGLADMAYILEDDGDDK